MKRVALVAAFAAADVLIVLRAGLAALPALALLNLPVLFLFARKRPADNKE